MVVSVAESLAGGGWWHDNGGSSGVVMVEVAACRDGYGGGVLMGGALVAVKVTGRWLLAVVGSGDEGCGGDGSRTFDLAVHDFDWFFDEMKLVVELTFISRND
nr:hypothetical protein [Tanacetum cinerariifolium]